MEPPRTSSVSGRARAAGEGLLHPAVLAALGLLILNDHVLKQAMPGVLTGKLSDVAGLVVFPVLLVAAWELAGRARGHGGVAGSRVTAGAVIVTGLAFALVKTQPGVADAFGLSLGVAQWLLALPVHLTLGQPVPAVAAARVLADPTDLLAIPALAIALRFGRSTRVPSADLRRHVDPAAPRARAA